jgi:hypothetical protein
MVNAYWPGSDQLFRLLPGRSPQQLTHILEMLAAVDLPNRDIESRLLHEAPRLPWGATIAIVTAVTYDALLDAIARLAHAGRKVALFTLADEPPAHTIPGLQVHHLPHLSSRVAKPAETLS